MAGARRKLAFVLASSNHGTMIVNRLDYRMINAESGHGVGFQILETASFDPAPVQHVHGDLPGVLGRILLNDVEFDLCDPTLNHPERVGRRM